MFGREYKFRFELQIDDDVSGNNTWERTSCLYPFRDVAPELGVDDPGKGWAGAFANYDSDGDLDIYISNGGSLGRGANILYRNDLERGFTDVTEASGTADEGNGTGLVFADFDRDNLIDLLIAKGGFFPAGESNRLFYADSEIKPCRNCPGLVPTSRLKKRPKYDGSSKATRYPTSVTVKSVC